MEDLTEYENVPFTCYCCRKLIYGLQAFEDHLQTSHFKCEICGRAFRTENAKIHHYNIHNVGKGKWNERRSYIGGTMANSESKEVVKIQYQCEFCEEILTDITEWRQHRSETHSMEYIPNTQDQSMPDPMLALDLVMTKLNVKAQKSYAYLIKCPAENCGFFPATMIYNHIQKDHPQSSLRYNCSICGDIFVSEYDVIEHKSTAHSGHNNAAENADDVGMDVVVEGEDILDGTVNICTTEEGGVTVTVQSTQEVLDTVFNNPDNLVQTNTGKSNAVFLSKRDNVNTVKAPMSINLAENMELNESSYTHTETNQSINQVNAKSIQQKQTAHKNALVNVTENDENEPPEYVTFVEGDKYVDEKNDIQLNLLITRAPINNTAASQSRSRKPNLMNGPRGLVKPKPKLRQDLVGAGSSSMLTVLTQQQPSSDNAVHLQHQHQVVVPSSSVQSHHQPHMIVMSTAEDSEVPGQTYIIQHEDGNQIQEIQAKVVTEGTVMEETVESSHHQTIGAEQTILHVQQAGDHQDGGNEDEDGISSEQTILHVPASDAGQQPTFVIQSQEFQVR